MCQLSAKPRDETTVAAPIAALLFLKDRSWRPSRVNLKLANDKADNALGKVWSKAAWQVDSSYLWLSEEKTGGHLSSCLRQRFKVLQHQTLPLPNTNSSGLHQQAKTVGSSGITSGIRFSNLEFLCRRLISSVQEPLPPAATQQEQQTEKEVHTSQTRTDVTMPLWSHFTPRCCVTCQEASLARTRRFVAYSNGPKHEKEHEGGGGCRRKKKPLWWFRRCRVWHSVTLCSDILDCSQSNRLQLSGNNYKHQQQPLPVASHHTEISVEKNRGSDTNRY